MSNDLSGSERIILGVVAFILCLLPIVALALLIVPGFLGAAAGSGWFMAGMLTLIISAGLQLPIYFVLAEAASERVPDGEKWSLVRVRHPFYIFTFWWRYVRQQPASPPS